MVGLKGVIVSVTLILASLFADLEQKPYATVGSLRNQSSGEILVINQRAPTQLRSTNINISDASQKHLAAIATKLAVGDHPLDVDNAVKNYTA